MYTGFHGLDFFSVLVTETEEGYLLMTFKSLPFAKHNIFSNAVVAKCVFYTDFFFFNSLARSFFWKNIAG